MPNAPPAPRGPAPSRAQQCAAIDCLWLLQRPVPTRFRAPLAPGSQAAAGRRFARRVEQHRLAADKLSGGSRDNHNVRQRLRQVSDFVRFFDRSMVGRGRPIRPSLRPLRCLAALVWLRWPRPRRLRLLRIARTDAVRFDLCPASADTLSIVLIFLLGRAWVADSLLHLLRVHAAVCARDGGGA